MLHRTDASRQAVEMGQERRFCLYCKGLLILRQHPKDRHDRIDGKPPLSARTSVCSDVHLLRYGQSIINIDAQIAHRALNLRVSTKKLDRA